MRTRTAVSEGVVAKVFCVLGICLMVAVGLAALQGSAAAGDKGAEPVVNGSMKFADKTVAYTDAAGGIYKGNGNIIIHLDNEKINREEVAQKLQEDGMVAASNHLELTFDKKGKLLYHAFQVSEGGTSNSAGGMSVDGIASKVTISKGRAKGRVYSKTPLKLFDNKYTFDVTFDVEVSGGK